MALKRKTPLLDELESGPWPSFVTDIKRMAEKKPACEDLLGVMELSYEEKIGHWKHGGIVGVMGYGGGVIGRYSDQDTLVRVFDAESLARRLHTGDITSTLVYERNGAVRGFINFTVHELLSRRGRYRWAWLDFLYWKGLTNKERKALLSAQHC